MSNGIKFRKTPTGVHGGSQGSKTTGRRHEKSDRNMNVFQQLLIGLSFTIPTEEKKLSRRPFFSRGEWNKCLRNCILATNQRYTLSIMLSCCICVLLKSAVEMHNHVNTPGPSSSLLQTRALIGRVERPLENVFKMSPSEKLEEESPLQKVPTYSPDYGGINYTRLKLHKASGPRRMIAEDDEHQYALYRSQLLADIDDSDMGSRYYSKEDLEDEERECMDVEWVGKHYPICNVIHEIPVERPTDLSYGQTHNVSYLSSGCYRDAWRFRRPDFVEDDFVVKRYMIMEKHKWSGGDLYKVHTEASIMERLSATPRILNIYGYCGTTVHVETMASDIHDKIIYGDGWVAQAELDKLDGVFPRNNLTISEKLQISLAMAESLVDLHEFEGGVIYHADTHIEQWLAAPDGSIKLNDFNNAKIMKWNKEEQRYCPNYSWYGHVYRSPEEYEGWAQDQSVDIFSYGNNIYTMLTGLWPFYDEEFRRVRHSKIQNLIVKGRRPFVDDRYRARSYIERQLIHLMKKCWAQDPKKRPPMSEVANFLRKVKDKAKIKGELKESNWIKII